MTEASPLPDGRSHVVIVSHGRSGSTLLQAILNSIDGWRIWGENYDFPRGLHFAETKLRETKWEKWRDASHPSAPWFGARSYDPDAFASALGGALREQLAKGAPADAKTIGFKEIRFTDLTKDGPAPLLDYLDFLAGALKPCKFILLSRDLEQTRNSGWFRKMAPEDVAAEIEPFHAALDRVANIRSEDAFRITYDDLKADAPRLHALFEFLDVDVDREALRELLSKPHSFANRAFGEKRDIGFISPEEWHPRIKEADDLQRAGDFGGAKEIYQDHVEKVRAGRILRLPIRVAHRADARSYMYIKLDDLRLAYFYLPKNASTTIKQMMFRILKNRTYDWDADGSVHDVLNPTAPLLELEKLDAYFKFAVVRDPIERFISAFRNRILHHKDGIKNGAISHDFEDINYFVAHLEHAMAHALSVQNHFSEQRLWLGGELGHLDRVYKMGETAEVKTLLEKRSGLTLEDSPKQTGGPKLSHGALTRASLDTLLAYYKRDYELLADYYDPETQIARWRKERGDEA